ncbi:MAG: cytochrome c maturation protein CcmE [Acidobacteria bacterium]|nr:cytochrome c maturation protein CcmE [Acidobacteriota bacterium]
MQRGRKKLQFGIGLGIILIMISWLAYSGIQESKTYYVTVGELQAKSDAHQRRYRVGGNVSAGSIRKAAGKVEFSIEQDGKVLPVVYTGKDTLPDTLQDGAEAMADGRYLKDGTFHAETVQAKCASKYEPAAMPTEGAAPKPAANWIPPR